MTKLKFLLALPFLIYTTTISAQDCSLGYEDHGINDIDLEYMSGHEIIVDELSTVTSLAFNSVNSGSQVIMALYSVPDPNEAPMDLVVISDVGICDGSAVVLDCPDTQLIPGNYRLMITFETSEDNIKLDFSNLITKYTTFLEWGDPIPESTGSSIFENNWTYSIWANMDCGWSDCSGGTKTPILPNDYNLIGTVLYATSYTFYSEGYLTAFGINAVSSNSEIRIGLWEDNGSGEPGNLLLQTDVVSCSPGVNIYDVTDMYIPAGSYYLGAIGSTTLTITSKGEPGYPMDRAFADVNDLMDDGSTYDWIDNFTINLNMWVEMSCDPIGCTDINACNYDSNAGSDDGSCDYGPPHDDCGGALELNEGLNLIDNSTACYDGGEIIPGTGCNEVDGWCAFETEMQNSVYYYFNAPSEPATVTIETFLDGSNTLTDTQMAVFFDDCGGELVGANDDGGTDQFMSYLQFDCGVLEPSTTYIVLIDGYNGSSGTAAISLTISYPECTLCEGDANNDGNINIVDALAVSSNFGCTGVCEGDANGDLVVNILDLLAVSANWGFSCP